ncbi:MAG: NADH-quinone oxidoreductase subunit J [Streptosporangiales bacterium]
MAQGAVSAAGFPAETIGFWFVSVLLVVAAVAAGATRRYILSAVAGFIGLICILFGLGTLPIVDGAEAAAFWICSLVAVPAAVTMVAARKAVHSALCLAAVMISLAILYLVLNAPFLAFVQIIVYTGAVLMLFLFVVMLVGVQSADSLVETIRGQRAAAIILGLGFLLLVLSGVGAALAGAPAGSLAQANSDGNVLGLARLIFTRYVFAFEVTSALLITAAVGAMVLGHRERADRASQKTLQRRRIAGPHPSPLSPPGVFARHNAVDTPALLPDGTPADESVHPVFQGGRREHISELAPEEEVEDGRSTVTAARPELGEGEQASSNGNRDSRSAGTTNDDGDEEGAS